MKSRVVVPLAVAGLLVFGCSEGPSCMCVEIRDWEAALSGSSVIPPVSTTASGEARLWLDQNDDLHFVVRVVGVTAADDARLYFGPPNENGVPRATLCEPCSAFKGVLASGGIQPQGTTPAALLTQVRVYGTYIEIRSGGAALLRGQIRWSEP